MSGPIISEEVGASSELLLYITKPFLVAGRGKSEHTTNRQAMFSALGLYLKYISSLKPIWRLTIALLCLPATSKEPMEMRIFPP